MRQFIEYMQQVEAGRVLACGGLLIAVGCALWGIIDTAARLYWYCESQRKGLK
jgi:hypothetical protein